MKPIDFPETNLFMKAGDNPGTEGMKVSKAFQMIGGSWYPSLVTKFKLSPEELQRISETGELYVCILGTGMPPIMPTVQNPFTELDFVKQ